ncbi:hypothetical protein [Primorskyibacter marinus]|uniref:hypothetical protein n=1 Tax=Primorskyibacter marinus TaxID=1977320 RepID=UPI0013001820|nr:hypothetical protein [Primorskyibacter marinus]
MVGFCRPRHGYQQIRQFRKARIGLTPAGFFLFLNVFPIISRYSPHLLVSVRPLGFVGQHLRNKSFMFRCLRNILTRKRVEVGGQNIGDPHMSVDWDLFLLQI